MKPYIIGINGSPRKNGLCGRLLRVALRSAEKSGAQTKIIHLVDHEKIFYRNYFARKPAKDFVKISDELVEANGMILATPVMWLNMSALMKNFFEQLTFLEIQNYQLQGLVAGLIATQDLEGGWKTTLDMVGPLNHMGVMIPPYCTAFYNRAMRQHRKGRWMYKDIKLVGRNVTMQAKMNMKHGPIWQSHKSQFKSGDIEVSSDD